ncbi:MAG: zinc ABC transporter solute-binding protein [Proteobacteria bacterium]|jgi:ABC-type Zn uptake system ZnuABC Zn-binding protein ZnuA|nr:zinc ABC transporter solute-binding protein [Pseudomonadota bacterium]
MMNPLITSTSDQKLNLVALSNRVVLLLALLFSASPSSAIDVADGLKVVTGTQATYSIARALLEDTSIETVNVPEDGRRFNSLKDYIERRTSRFEPLFKSADAVVAVTNALPADPLYRFAREANINLVYIDAAQPWSLSSPGVALVEQPSTNVAWATDDTSRETVSDAPYFWLSLTNAIRMTDIVGVDLARTFPEFAELILSNRDALKVELLALYREFQNQLLDVADISVFALANEFVYLTNDMGLYVDGYFLKQDIDWTDEDLDRLTAHLQSREIKVVLHKWEPSEAIQGAVQAAGAELVVLDTADPGLTVDRKLVTDGYQQILRGNLEKIILGFAR